MENVYDVIIIGAGPAGMTAAVYASRAGLKTAILEKAAPGGKMVETFEIENYPGFSSVNGADLAGMMFEHATRFGAEYLYGDVKTIRDLGAYKEVVIGEETFKTRAVIIATGTVERKLSIPGESEFAGRGVSYCAVCDGAFFRDKTVTVIGGGNSALGGALYLTKFASKVNVVIRRDVFRATKTVQDDVYANPKIHVIVHAVPAEIRGTDAVKSIVLKNVETGELTEVETDAVFPYIGADPMTSSTDELPLEKDHGYIVTNDRMETGVPGVYAAGDVRKKDLRQVVTATNDGAIAAEEAGKYLA